MPERESALRYDELAGERFGDPADFTATFVSGSIVALHELRQEITAAQQSAARTINLHTAIKKLEWSNYLLNSYFVPLHETLDVFNLRNGRSVAAVETARSAARQAVAVSRTTGADTFDQEAFWRMQALRVCSESSSLYPVVVLEETVMKVRSGEPVDPSLLTQQFQEVVWCGPESAEKLALYAWWITEAGLRLKSPGLTEYGWGLVHHFSQKTDQSPRVNYLWKEGIVNIAFPLIRRMMYRGNPQELLPRIPQVNTLSGQASSDILRSDKVDRTVLA